MPSVGHARVARSRDKRRAEYRASGPRSEESLFSVIDARVARWVDKQAEVRREADPRDLKIARLAECGEEALRQSVERPVGHAHDDIAGAGVGEDRVEDRVG